MKLLNALATILDRCISMVGLMTIFIYAQGHWPTGYFVATCFFVGGFAVWYFWKFFRCPSETVYEELKIELRQWAGNPVNVRDANWTNLHELVRQLPFWAIWVGPFDVWLVAILGMYPSNVDFIGDINGSRKQSGYDLEFY